MARKKKRSEISVAIPITALILALGGILTALAFFGAPATDATTGCPKDSSLIPERLAILLDTTDPYSRPQTISAVDKLQTRVAKLEPFSQVSVYTMTPAHDETASFLSFSACKPEKNAFASPLQQRLEQARFRELLSEALEKINATQESSRIIKSIGEVAAPLKADSDWGGRRSLVVVSDLIEFSELASMYQPLPAFNSEVGRKISAAAPDLSDVSIEIMMMRRVPHPAEVTDLVDWWATFFADLSGGNLDRIQQLRGL